MLSQVIGTCSLCGGAVTVPHGVWMSVIPPEPTCSRCGATAAAHGPVIPMQRPRYATVTSTSTSLLEPDDAA